MPSVLTPLVSRREQLCDRDPAISLAKSSDTLDGFVDFFLSPVHLGDDSGDGSTMTGDDKGFASFYIIEQLRQMSLGFGRLDLAHGFT
jgi:hypothetical protein